MADSMRESITTQTVSSSHVKHKKAMLNFLVIYGRLHTRVNYDSNCVVKPCKIKTIRCKNYFAMLDSTQESISTQTVSLSHVNKTNSMQTIILLWQTQHESKLRLKLFRQAM